jgi:hypothetical protein
MLTNSRTFYTALLALLVAITVAAATALGGLHKLNDVDKMQPTDLSNQTRMSGSGCTWWDYACDMYYYGYIPSDEDGDPFAQRFPCEVACSLKTIQMTLYDGYPDFSDTSGLGIDVIVWDDDGFGFPGAERARINLPSSELVYYPSNLSIDVQSAGLVFNDDFHIGYTTVDQVNDNYGILLDDGSCGYQGSTHYFNGVWESILDHFGVDANFLIAAEVCGQSQFVAHFTTPEGVPYPFNVITSDGENVQEFVGVDSVAALVSPDFTLRLDYEVDSHFVMMDWELSLEPCKSTEFEFYAVDPNKVSARDTTYINGKQVGTSVNMQSYYSEIDTSLTYTVQTMPLGRYVFVGTWIQAATDMQSKTVNPGSVVKAHKPIEIDSCTNGSDWKRYYTDNQLDSTVNTTWLPRLINIPPDDDDSLAIVSHEFHRFSGDLAAVGVRKATGNHVRVPGYDVALLTPDLQSHSADYFYPQWVLPPDSSYCLEMTSESPDHASLTYPLLIPDSTNGLIFDPYLPPIAELAPYDFRIAGENTFANSSHSELEYYPGDSMVVNVSTDTPCDYWGCFVLPDDQDFVGIVAYTETGGVEALEYFTDWFEQEESGFKLITVRIEPPYDRLCLAFVDIWASISGKKFHDLNHNCVQDAGENFIPGFQINLIGPVSTSVHTGQQGEYTFGGLPAGTYKVIETVPSQWVQTCPASVYYRLNLQASDHLAGIDFGNDSCEISEHSYETCVHGTKDNFIGPEPSYSNPDLISHIQTNCNDYQPDFDSPTDDQCFGHTFDNCWDNTCLVVEAQLCIKLRASGDIPGNDTFGIVYCDGTTCQGVWSISINDLENYCNPGSGPWQEGDVLECCLDLKALPFSPNHPTTNILANIQDGDLDIVMQDDTEIDYIEMSVELCCPPSDTGACCDCDSLDQPYCFYTDRQTCRDSNGIFYPGLTCDQVQCDTCYACGDTDGDGICLTVNDLEYLFKFLFCGGPEPHPLCQADLNCDEVVDADDYHVFKNYFIYGLAAFPCGYPAATAVCPSVTTYLLGDSDGSGEIDIDDVVHLIYYIFASGPAPNPIECGDVDHSGFVDIDDIVFLINYIFAGGPSPCDSKGLQYSYGDSQTGEFDAYALESGSLARIVDGHAILNVADIRDERGEAVTLTLEANIAVQALQLEFKIGSGVSDLTATSLTDGIQVFSGEADGLFKVGLFDLRGATMIPSGSTEIARVSYSGGGEIELVNSAAVAKGGGRLTTTVNRSSTGEVVVPLEYALRQNVPNPFNPTTEIAFSLAVESRVKLEVFNITGQKVATLLDERMTAGNHTVTWNGRASSGEPAASGVYFYRITAGNFTESRKMLLLK